MSASSERIVIIGTGFGGLGMAIRLKQKGIEDFIVLERASEIGGTWRDNHYPGAACDVMSHLYSFSFEPNPEWTRAFAPQQEIFAYLNHCADKYGIRPHIRFGTGVESAAFDEQRGLWTLALGGGTAMKARVVVAACGPLNKPSLPDIPGVSSFEGDSFHSSRWNHEVSLEGKTVAVIGTGASAIQVVPSIVTKVKKLTLFQRTPAWVVPKPDREITPSERRRFRRFPLVQKIVRVGIYWRSELFGYGFVKRPGMLKLASTLVGKYIEKSIPDVSLRAKLTPNYVMGCKRILLSSDYYPALSRPNAEVVTSGISEIRPHGIVTKDGVEHAVDAIVYCTGFHAAEAVEPFEIRGRNGVDLNTAWKNGAEAYLGCTIAGFPNLFLIVGPNTGLGHTSMIFMIESQVAYALGAIEAMRERKLKSVEVRRDTQSLFNAQLQERMKRTVWATGCESWYQTRSGKNTTLWPGFTVEFRLRTRRFDLESYVTEPLEAAREIDVTLSHSEPVSFN